MEQWYYKQNEQKIGPFPEDLLIQMLETKLLSGGTQVCSDTNAEWTMAREAEPFSKFSKMPSSFSAGRHAHPWMRYWARMIDNTLFCLFGGFALGIAIAIVAIMIGSDFPAIPNVIYTPILLLLYIPFEALLLATVGTTVGKAIVGMRLRKPDGGKLSFGTALRRSMKVTVKGIAVGLPIISLFTLFNAYNNLSSDGITSWDLNEQVLVTHKKTGAARMTFLVLIIIGVFSLNLFFILGS